MPRKGTGTRTREVPCIVCGTVFTAKLGHIERGFGKYCSRQCYGVAINFRVVCTCKTCGTSFTVTRSGLKRGEGVYCSGGCYHVSQRGPRTDLGERFWSKVDKNGPVPEHMPHLGPCWLWTAARQQGSGYGLFGMHGASALAHRVVWELAHGEIPPDLFVLHQCDTRACVRPDHLFLGNHQENMTDMVNKRRQCGTGKVVDAQVRQAIQWYVEGIGPTAIARRLNVNRSTVYHWLNGKNRPMV